MNNIEKACIEKNLKLTSQRKIIAEVISNSKIRRNTIKHYRFVHFASDPSNSDTDWRTISDWDAFRVDLDEIESEGMNDDDLYFGDCFCFNINCNVFWWRWHWESEWSPMMGPHDDRWLEEVLCFGLLHCTERERVCL